MITCALIFDAFSLIFNTTEKYVPGGLFYPDARMPLKSVLQLYWRLRLVIEMGSSDDGSLPRLWSIVSHQWSPPCCSLFAALAVFAAFAGSKSEGRVDRLRTKLLIDPQRTSSIHYSRKPWFIFQFAVLQCGSNENSGGSRCRNLCIPDRATISS